MDNTSVMKQIYQFYLNHKYDIKRHRKLNFFINFPSIICIIIIILAHLLINDIANHALKNCFIQLSNFAFLSFLPICIARYIIVYIQEHLQLKIAMQEIHKNLSSPIVRNSSMRVYLTLYAMNKIEEMKSLTQTMNSTKAESEFFNCYEKIIEILTELKKYESLGIYTTALPSAEIKRFEREKHLYIESLNKRILNSKNSIAQNRDEYFIEAGKFVIERNKASIGILQRVFKVSYNRAAQIMEQLYYSGVVGPEEGIQPRKILMNMDEFEYICSHPVMKNAFENDLSHPLTNVDNILDIETDYSNDGKALYKLTNIIIPSATNEIQINFINTLLKFNSQKTMKLLLIDDSLINYQIYNRFPQLLFPVITDKHRINVAVNWVRMEMDERIRKFLDAGAKNIDLFNQKMSDTGGEQSPRIICVVNEANIFFDTVTEPLVRIFMNSDIVGIYFILFSRFTLKNVSLGILKDLLEVSTGSELLALFSQDIGVQDKKEEYINFSYDNMTGYEFEHFCAELLRKNNFKNVEVTQISGDHGIDILAEKDDISYAIQCKCYSSNIGNAAIQQAHTGKTLYNKDIALVLTNQYFTQQAIDEANALGVKLWDRDKLNQMIAN